MGKEEIDNLGIFGILLSSPLRLTFVQMVEFDWLSGQQKGLIFIKMLKNLLLRNYKG